MTQCMIVSGLLIMGDGVNAHIPKIINVAKPVQNMKVRKTMSEKVIEDNEIGEILGKIVFEIRDIGIRKRGVVSENVNKLVDLVSKRGGEIRNLEHVIEWHDCLHGLDLKELYKESVLRGKE